jgi:peroxiredoxin
VQASLLAAVIVVGALGLLNLVLTLAVIRRLRERPAAAGQAEGPAPPTILAAGERPPAFEATTIDGGQISGELLAGEPAVIAFFSTTCRFCLEKVPDFRAYVSGLADARRPIAVVNDDAERATELVAALSLFATVVVEPMDGPIATAFMVTGFPTFYLLDGAGRVQAGGLSVARLPAHVSR